MTNKVKNTYISIKQVTSDFNDEERYMFDVAMVEEFHNLYRSPEFHHLATVEAYSIVCAYEQVIDRFHEFPKLGNFTTPRSTQFSYKSDYGTADLFRKRVEDSVTRPVGKVYRSKRGIISRIKKYFS